MVGDRRFSVRAAHLFEERCRGWVVAYVVEGLNPRVPLHVRLPGEDEDFERLCMKRIRKKEGDERENRDDGLMAHKRVRRLIHRGPGGKCSMR